MGGQWAMEMKAIDVIFCDKYYGSKEHRPPLVRTDKYFVSFSSCNPTAFSHWFTQSQKEDDIYYLFTIG